MCVCVVGGGEWEGREDQECFYKSLRGGHTNFSATVAIPIYDPRRLNPQSHRPVTISLHFRAFYLNLHNLLSAYV